MSYIPQGVLPGGTEVVSATVVIDTTATGVTSLFVVPTGKTFVPLQISSLVTNVSGFISVAIASSGANNPTYNDLSVIPIGSVINTLNANTIDNFNNAYVAGSNISVNVTAASMATTLDVTVTLIGYYI